ncbi:hypothetical protein Tco_0116762 [Tanacetum coccineum]
MLAQHLVAATYSASAEDIATDCYFLALQHTSLPPSNRQALEVLFLKILLTTIRYIRTGDVIDGMDDEGTIGIGIVFGTEVFSVGEEVGS